MKTLLLTILAISALGLNTSHAVTYTLSGPMDVFQATTNAANVGNGSGSILGDYDDSTNKLNYAITWTDLTSSITNMHFHLGAPGTPGGVDLGIPGPWSSPQMGSGITLNGTHEGNLLSGNWYVNVHTVQFPGGEIRGQVNVLPVPEPATVCMAAVAFLSVVSLARRKRVESKLYLL